MGSQGSSVHGTYQARILEQGAISYSRESSQPRDPTHVSCVSCIGRRSLYHLCYLGSSVLPWLSLITSIKSLFPNKVPFTGIRGEDFSVSLGASRGVNSTHNSDISKKLTCNSENHLKEEIKVTLSDLRTSFKVTVIKIVLLAKDCQYQKKVQKWMHTYLVNWFMRKVSMQFNKEIKIFSTSGARIIIYLYRRKMNNKTYYTVYLKINLR